jgi:hypothetical protein
VELRHALEMDPRTENVGLEVAVVAALKALATLTEEQVLGPDKKGRKIRQWFRHTFNRK